jgi:hypothetical protein
MKLNPENVGQSEVLDEMEGFMQHYMVDCQPHSREEIDRATVSQNSSNIFERRISKAIDTITVQNGAKGKCQCFVE